MAGGWTRDGGVQDQKDSQLKWSAVFTP